MSPRRLLVVTADDYGLTRAVSRGVLRARRDGILTTTSVLALGPAVATAARWWRDEVGPAAGAHLAAVGEDRPLLSRREIPTLVDRRGRLPRDWRAFLLRAAAGRIDPADVEREFTEQLDHLTRDLRLRPTHLDTHQHLHLWPAVARVVVDLAVCRGVPAVRVPTSAAGGPRGRGVRRLGRALAARVAAAGLASTEGFAGLDEAGRMDAPRLLGVLARAARGPAVTVEVNCHPGAGRDPERSRYAWGYTWEAELAALLDPRVRAAVDAHGFRLGTHADLPAVRWDRRRSA